MICHEMFHHLTVVFRCYAVRSVLVSEWSLIHCLLTDGLVWPASWPDGLVRFGMTCFVTWWFGMTCFVIRWLSMTCFIVRWLGITCFVVRWLGITYFVVRCLVWPASSSDGLLDKKRSPPDPTSTPSLAHTHTHTHTHTLLWHHPPKHSSRTNPSVAEPCYSVASRLI